MDKKINMVDLQSQYQRLKPEIDEAIQRVLNHGIFINGPEVAEFSTNLANFLGVKHVIPCGNGTDALMLSLLALNLEKDAEIIVPAFSYMAAAEMVALCGLTPVLVDVDKRTFNLQVDELEQSITARTKAIIPVHLFGQCCNMEPLMKLAKKYDLTVIEDNAQSLGCEYTFLDETTKYAGTIGRISCTSFFPAKNLGCYGDGGALMTDDDELADRLRKLANHGQSKKYYHELIGCNSRLDTIQAAILNVKLKYLKNFNEARKVVAERYTAALKGLPDMNVPILESFSTHVYNQYTLRVKNNKRDELKKHLEEKGIPSMIYYALPIQKQPAMHGRIRMASSLEKSTELCNEVLSLPIHTEMKEPEQSYIIENVLGFFK